MIIMLKKLVDQGLAVFIFGCFAHPAFTLDDFPLAKGFQKGFLSLPVHQQLQAEDITEIARRVNLTLCQR